MTSTGNVSMDKETSLLDYVESHITVSEPKSVKKILADVARAAEKNQQQRLKYEQEPMKFLESEEILYNAVKQVSLLTLEESWFEELLKSGAIEVLKSLLDHENSDIVAAVLQIFAELSSGGENQPDSLAFCSHLLDDSDNNIIDDIATYLLRHPIENEQDPDEVGWIYWCVSFLDSIEEIEDEQGEDGESHLASNDAVIKLLFDIISTKQHSADIRPTKATGMELLFKILYRSPSQKLKQIFGKSIQTPIDRLDILLTEAQRYQNRIPQGALEKEYASNLFDVLALVAGGDYEMKRHLYDLEGMELFSLLLRKGSIWVRDQALTVIDHSLRGFGLDFLAKVLATPNDCRQLVKILGKTKPTRKAALKEKIALKVVSIISAMLNNLPRNTVYRDTLIVAITIAVPRCLENLVEFRHYLHDDIAKVRQKNEEEKQKLLNKYSSDNNEEVWLAEVEWEERLVSAGAEYLFHCDVILAHLLSDVSNKTVELVENEMKKARVSKNSIIESLRMHLQDDLEIIEKEKEKETEEVLYQNLLEQVKLVNSLINLAS